MGLILAILLTVDGGGDYTSIIDYEWPGSSTSMLQWNTDNHVQLSDGGYAIGYTPLRGWDAGVLVDTDGVYFVRGPLNAWVNISTGNSGWPDVANGGKYEVCHTPSWDSTLWRDGQSPNWDGTIYLFDANQVTQHTVAMMFGHERPSNLYVRVNGTYVTTLDVDVTWRAGQAYCTSVEWVPTTEDHCAIWVRHNSCGQTPVPQCQAWAVVAYTDNGGCPANASYVTLANRQYGYDESNLAPTTVHVSAIRASAK